MNKELLIKRIEILQAQIDLCKEELAAIGTQTPDDDWDKPPFEKGDPCFHVNYRNRPRIMPWSDSVQDMGNWRGGNAFKTKEEAEICLNKRVALARIWRHADYLNKKCGRGHSRFIADDCNYVVHFDLKESKCDVSYSLHTMTGCFPYFSNGQIAQKHLEVCEQDYRLLFDVSD
ncbi:MAG: hypothetical protein MJA29_04395 [Candidatus Omnitrophica bacterium]|nr:hypothetical protein [Candidatus Omnitrophota bacterium]